MRVIAGGIWMAASAVCAFAASAASASAVSSFTSAHVFAMAGDTVVPANDSMERRERDGGGEGAREGPRECDRAKPEWLFCDDFEVDRLARYFEYNARGESFMPVAGAGIAGSIGMRAHFERGQVDAGSLRIAFGKTPSSYFRAVDSGTAVYRSIYWRFYIRTDGEWTGGGGDKMSRATVFADSTWAQAAIAHVWSGKHLPDANALVLDPASGTDESGAVLTQRYNDFAHLRWLGAQLGRTRLFDAERAGRWHCVEAHVQLNDPGRANGVFELWIDGARDARRERLDWVGRFSAYGVNAVFLENYWNDGSPAAQSRVFDNFVVSRERIGCTR
jgi:hypothetical protein